MKDLKQGKIIHLNASKKEALPVVGQKEKQKVEQMYTELQEISQKIDQHLTQSNTKASIDQLPIEERQKAWQQTLFAMKKKLLKTFRLPSKFHRLSRRWEAIRKKITVLEQQKNKRNPFK